ncbi:MAG: hypothetical protein JST59_09255 [Actinobacteria bacterium]|nr:hypothetical protein [Actinomycetota bacterium]
MAMLMLGLLLLAPSALAAPPPNDDFATAQVLSGALPLDVPASNVEATREAGEPIPAFGSPAGHSVWFRWEAPSTEVITVSACTAQIEPLIGVFVGSELSGLTEVAGNHWGPGCDPRATFTAVAGKSYSIRVDGSTNHEASFPPPSAEGSFELQIERQAAPANDNFVNAEPIELDSSAVPAPNYGATKEPGEPAHQGNQGGASVWFKFTAPRSGGALLQANGGPIGHKSLLAVYTGTSVSALTPVPSTEIWGGSALAFPVAAGVTYRIAVDGEYDPATGSPFMDEPEISLATFPRNDDFENAYRLTDGSLGSTFGSYGFGNIGATKQAGEPDHAGNPGGASVWFRWTAYESGSVRMSVCGADFHTLLAVYTGSALSGVSPVAASSNPQSPPCNPFAQGSRELSFDVDAGTEYRIAVDGYEGAWGSFGIEMETSKERLPLVPTGEVPPSTSTSLAPASGKRAARRPQTMIARRNVEPGRRLATFHLRSDEPHSTFRCRLDSRPFVRCQATVIYRNLEAGRHVFESEAVNSRGDPDRTPAVFRFKIRPAT